MRNVLALQALDLSATDALADAVALESWSTISYYCCTQSYTKTAEIVITHG